MLLFGIAAFLGSYLRTKATNLATKEDLAQITREVEAAKQEILRHETIQDAKWQLKHDACLEALSIIDVHLSNYFIDPPPKVESADTAAVRKCHSRLILSCDDPSIVDLFCDILVSTEGDPRHKLEQLSELRNRIRAELSFGEEVVLDEERVWFFWAAGDKPESQGTAGDGAESS